jgi:dimethylhistidine N-methyltransferase
MKTTDRDHEAPAVGEAQRFRADVLRGLRRPARELPCKYFYDEAGSRLFEEICGLDEYYLTRTELGIMRRHAADMAALLGPDCLLVEYGSGSSLKTRLLLDRLRRPAAYVPVDVSCGHLTRSAAAVAAAYPGLEVLPLCADFTGLLRLPASGKVPARRVVYFPGSTLGNFGPPEAAELLTQVARLCGRGGGLLLGIDLRKDVRLLEAAYNDRRGVTAAFNLNLLARINRELGADFDLDAFRHLAFYNHHLSCIEMHLISTQRQWARVGGEAFLFAGGETIRTERSYKYDVEEFRVTARRCGLGVERVWADERNFFAVLYLTVTGP